MLHFSVDGYDRTTNTVYEFNGGVWHGCPHLQQRYQKTPDGSQPLEQAYQKYMAKKKFILEQGYGFTVVWECDFHKVCLV